MTEIIMTDDSIVTKVSNLYATSTITMTKDCITISADTIDIQSKE